MTPYELSRVATEWAMPALYGDVRKRLRRHVPSGSTLVDIGGRKSWYTSGLPYRVTVTDIPRENSTQHELGLGMTAGIGGHLTGRRSNVDELVIDDLASTNLSPGSFDAAVSVEVIEHVDDDASFVKNLAMILRDSGVAVLTTPNGDRQPNPVGDHKRHYRREQLAELLESEFSRVIVEYAVVANGSWIDGLRSFDPKHPLQATRTSAANVANRRSSGSADVAQSVSTTAHLIAVAWK